LRGNESDEDNGFVEMFAKKYNMPFYNKKFETTTYAKDHSISIQMAARELRINWFEELVSEHGYSYYATAHHLDDQIETILNNFFRGTGISGLHGILPKRGNLIHPMLFCYRNQIEEYAIQNKITYRTDSSNKKTNYIRNKVRHQLIPNIETIFPKYQKTISDNAKRLHQVESIYKKHIQQTTDELIDVKEDFIKISIEKLLHLQPVEMYLFELINPFGFNYTIAEDIVNAINSNSGKYFLSDSYKITKDRKELIIEKRTENITKEYLIEKEAGKITEPIHLNLLYSENTTDFKILKSASIANLDHKKIKYPLKLRKWQKGDHFYPLGMNHKKLVSDFFIDNKVSVPEKDKTWLLISEEQIVWVIGHRIDNRFKISENTASILTIEYFE